MNDDKGKVIFSLLAGATAGIVAGLLLAPETGDEARSSLLRSATKLREDLSKRVNGLLGKIPAQEGHTNPDAAVSEDKEAADRLLDGLSAGAPPTDFAQRNADYKAIDEEIRHTGTL
ncbi:YtxH domain-containing protein [Hymenobacter nivis]|nr:YtxH domain-containing protein [Hymenobacter nivis]